MPVCSQPKLHIVENHPRVESGKPTVLIAPKGCEAKVYGSVGDESTRRKSWSDGKEVASVLVEEDFSKMTKGTEDSPDDERLAAYYGLEPGVNIDPSLTNQPGWTGHNVYSAGGAVLVKEDNITAPGAINTPLGDYSGSLTITFRYKILKGSTADGQVLVSVLKGGIGVGADVIGTNTYAKFAVYPGQEDWQEAEMRCTNKSADNDGFVQFCIYGNIIIDNIKITSTQNFIANPKLLPVTDFTATSFTANWEKVRLAYGYQMALKKKVFTADGDVSYSENFEDMASVPEGWTITNFDESRIVNGGKDGSKGLKLRNGDVVKTPFNFSKYKNFKFSIKLVTPEGVYPDAAKGNLHFRLTTLEGWDSDEGFDLSPMPVAYLAYYPEDFDFGTDLYPMFNNQYYGLTIYADELEEGSYLVLDNVSFDTGRPSELQDVITWDDYVFTEGRDTHYTFTNLDPECDYVYCVRSQYQDLYSSGVMGTAFGVAAPELAPATNVDKSGTYTANWRSVPKATSYIVANYGVRTATEDTKDFVLLDDDFSKIDETITYSQSPDEAEWLLNGSETYLDKYTKARGWTGVGNTIAQGWLGAADGSTVLNYLRTPPLTLSNAQNFTIRLKARGSVGENLVVSVNGNNYTIPFESTDLEGELEVPESGFGLPITFFTQNMSAFSLDYVTVLQDVKAGQSVFDFIESDEVDAQTLSYDFENLGYDYAKYAFDVVAKYDNGSESVLSGKNGCMIVDIASGSSTSGIKALGATDEEGNGNPIAYYGVDGSRLNAPKKGVNIVRFANGKTSKVIVR